MRKLAIALAAVAAIGIAIPTFAASPAEAHTVIVTKGKMTRDHDRHYGDRHYGHNHYGWNRNWQHRHRHHHHRHNHRHHHNHHHGWR